MDEKYAGACVLHVHYDRRGRLSLQEMGIVT
jgi:hypothetical protein